MKLIPLDEWPMFEDWATGTVYMVDEKGKWHDARSVISTVESVLKRDTERNQ